jgi:hypothetical protein
VNTTTLPLILAKQAQVIAGLAPTMLRELAFERAPKNLPLRAAIQEEPTSPWFRRFDIWPVAASQTSSFFSTEAQEVVRTVVATVAYPLDLATYGRNDLVDVLSVVESDARQIRDAIFSPDNYLAGQTAAFVELNELDRAFADLWFQEFLIELHYYEAMSL